MFVFLQHQNNAKKKLAEPFLKWSRCHYWYSYSHRYNTTHSFLLVVLTPITCVSSQQNYCSRSWVIILLSSFSFPDPLFEPTSISPLHFSLPRVYLFRFEKNATQFFLPRRRGELEKTCLFHPAIMELYVPTPYFLLPATDFRGHRRFPRFSRAQDSIVPCVWANFFFHPCEWLQQINPILRASLSAFGVVLL